MRRRYFAHPDGADLVFRNVGDRIDRAHGHIVGRAVERPVIGNKHCIRRMVFTTLARTVTEPRRLSTFTKSPSVMPSFPASKGCISHKGCGYWSTRAPIRRVCVPER